MCCRPGDSDHPCPTLSKDYRGRATVEFLFGPNTGHFSSAQTPKGTSASSTTTPGGQRGVAALTAALPFGPNTERDLRELHDDARRSTSGRPTSGSTDRGPVRAAPE
ncbi:hypothetical protein GGTG_04700 [Gaeumannomyces tritici R3-111a-1]|uniref:Uncharacterized protein n=1 Tax=Gaeumannomyces tritici (strain R3-111a-1) TaxID=644352 RepID=J3NTV1_GAET3|nr:hypothetical protein GGTG_04700 [Gaeumannomyces tritici R3-111a-1]EJT79616.1 hypothetical protein GGTG_04700 [Gaeumannomyces tritici R3-111a-1]